MKGILAIIFCIIFLSSNIVWADELSLTLVIVEGEKSKDSHYSEEVLNLALGELKYSIKHYGKNNPLDNDYVKKCILNEEQESTVKYLITEYSLNVNDTIISDNTFSYPNINYLRISLEKLLNGKTSKLLMNGEINIIAETIYYFKVEKLYSLLKQFIENC